MKKQSWIERFVRYMKRTYKNKLVAVLLVTLGATTVSIAHDATALVFVSLFLAIPLFFSNDDLLN